ncbi:MAG: hypothetical protein ACKPKO_15560, partial [Candidatus Fonsibacter sp.]
EDAAGEWTALWNKPHLADVIAPPADREDFERFLRQQYEAIAAQLEGVSGPLKGEQHRFGSFDAAGLVKAAKRMVRKAGACDQWTADALLQMPLPWWILLAQLWNEVLGRGIVPRRWTEAKTVLIPKSSGGWRPLTIAS